MPYRKEQFVNGEIYHIVIKRIADKLLFKDTDDYFRGIFSIFEFNNVHPVEIYKRRQEIQSFKKRLRETKGGPSSSKLPDVRNLLVEVLFFCFMPNHIHLALKQIKEGGIVKFMRKVGTGYGGYLNRKYGRKGYVFQNRFLAVHIKTEEQLKTVFVYIHTNAVSLIEPKWKEIGIKEPNKIIKFLEDYKWSSYPDYINKNNFPSVTERDLILKVMGGEEGCKNFVEGWIKHKVEIKESPELALE